MRSVRLAASPLALALALLAVSCGRTQAPPAAGDAGPAKTAAPARVNSLILAIEQEPDKLAQALNSMVYGTYICNTINGYFVRYDEQMNLIPEMITEVPTLENGGISADYLTYTYHLRPGMRWHDGQPVTSADVAFSVAALLDERHEVEGRTGFDKIASTETPDELTIVFKLKETYAPFVSDVFFDEAVWPKHLLESQVGPQFGAAAYHRAPVGCGPYKFKEWVTGSHVTVEANPDYWRGRPALDSITFRFIPDTNSMLLALQAGEVDGYDNAGTDQYARLKTMEHVQPYVTQQLMWEHLDFNTEDPILADARVRRAIALAVDREQISKEVYEGLWPVALGDINPRLHWYNPETEKLIRFDPIEAARLLDEAGWAPAADGVRAKDGQRLSLTISTTSGRRQRELVEQVLQQQLRKIGVELKVENHNATTFFAPHESGGILKRAKFQIALYAWISSPDPERFTQYHSSQVPPPVGQNHTRYRNPRMDELQEQGRREVDPVKRKALYDEIQMILARDVPMTSIIWRADIDPMTKRLKNFKPNPTQVGDTWNAWEWKLE